jgi:hypothetical protein
MGAGPAPKEPTLVNRRTTARTPLTGCKFCGLGPRMHDVQFSADVGWHRHALPTLAQLRARLRDHQVTVQPLDRATRTRAVAELLAHAVTGHAAVAITRAALAAGYLWRCTGCTSDLYADVVTCSCGGTRPAHVR